jgi:hypothetical protein
MKDSILEWINLVSVKEHLNDIIESINMMMNSYDWNYLDLRKNKKDYFRFNLLVQLKKDFEEEIDNNEPNWKKQYLQHYFSKRTNLVLNKKYEQVEAYKFFK